MLTLFRRTMLTLLVLQLGASVVRAQDDGNAPRSGAMATASARILAVCDVSRRSGPGCPTASLSSTSAGVSSAQAMASPDKANGLSAHTAVILNFE